MSLDENLGDLEEHARDFAGRRGFTFTVLSEGDVIGCVYIYPPHAEEPGRAGSRRATVRSWVRADRAALLRGAVGARTAERGE